MGSFIKDVTQKLCFLDRPSLSCHAKNDVTQCYSYITVTQVSKDPHFLLRNILYERPLVVPNRLKAYNDVQFKHNAERKRIDKSELCLLHLLIELLSFPKLYLLNIIDSFYII